MNKDKIGLYIHIPFCHSICPYCDFHKMVASSSLIDNYLKSLFKEAEIKNISQIPIQTLYIGGGTPSSLSLEQLEYLLSNLNKIIDLKNLDEFSIELNPHDINQELLKLLKKYYVSRLSIGIQTFSEKISNLINRHLSINEYENIIKLLEDNNFDNYSFDLIYGFKNQSIDDLKDDIDNLLNSNVKHISLYSIIIEPKTIFYKKVNEGTQIEASDEAEAKMYHFICQYLKQHGFHHYEISNFSKPGFESKHNLIYWHYNSYYSLGTGATQNVNGVEEKMTTKIHEYIDSLSIGKLPNHEINILNKEEIISDYVMMNLRLSEGININDFKERFNLDLLNVLNKVDYYLKNNYLIKEKDNLKLNEDYLFVSNKIIFDLLTDMRI